MFAVSESHLTQLDSTSRFGKATIVQEDPNNSHASFARLLGAQAVLFFNRISTGFSVDLKLHSQPEGLQKWVRKGLVGPRQVDAVPVDGSCVETWRHLHHL